MFMIRFSKAVNIYSVRTNRNGTMDGAAIAEKK
jgi:hypothetical protein